MISEFRAGLESVTDGAAASAPAGSATAEQATATAVRARVQPLITRVEGS
jgi:hypothetical protein